MALRARRLTGHAQGIVLALIASASFSAMDALAKLFAEGYPVGVIIWTRYVVHVVVMVIVIAAVRRSIAELVSARLRVQVLRGLLLLTSTATFFVGLTYLPLAQASAISSTGPLILMALAAPLLRERAGRAEWTGIGAAFLGATLIVKPGTSLFAWASLLPLATALSHSLYQIVTRRMADRDSAITTLFYTGLVGALVSTLGLALAPGRVCLPNLIPLVPLGVIGVFGHGVLLLAIRVAPVTVIAPFAYTSLVWAAVFSFVLWGFVPDPLSIVGMAAIGVGGFWATQARRREGFRVPMMATHLD